MTETTKAAARTITDRYVAVWSEPDPQSRRAAIAGLWEPDGVEYVEGTQFRGHEELDARIALSQARTVYPHQAERTRFPEFLLETVLPATAV